MPPRFWWVGAFGGAAAGIVYLLAQEVSAVLCGRPVDEPLRLFAGVVLGARALGPALSANDATVIGTLVVLIGSIGSGLIFAWLVFRFPGLAATPGTLLISGAAYGGALWLLTFYVLGVLFWPWLARTSPETQLVCAVAGFGIVLGACFVAGGIHRPSELE